jgi:hypothetical protein
MTGVALRVVQGYNQGNSTDTPFSRRQRPQPHVSSTNNNLHELMCSIRLGAYAAVLCLIFISTCAASDLKPNTTHSAKIAAGTIAACRLQAQVHSGRHSAGPAVP